MEEGDQEEEELGGAWLAARCEQFRYELAHRHEDHWGVWKRACGLTGLGCDKEGADITKMLKSGKLAERVAALRLLERLQATKEFQMSAVPCRALCRCERAGPGVQGAGALGHFGVPQGAALGEAAPGHDGGRRPAVWQGSAGWRNSGAQHSGRGDEQRAERDRPGQTRAELGQVLGHYSEPKHNRSALVTPTLTAVLLLTELAVYAPVLCSTAVGRARGQVRCRSKHLELFETMWQPLFCRHTQLRSAVATQLLAAWLETNVEAVFCNFLVERLFDPVDADLAQTEEGREHGGLLLLQLLVDHFDTLNQTAAAQAQGLSVHWEPACRKVISCLESPHQSVQQLALLSIPTLAKLSPVRFAQGPHRPLERAIEALLEALQDRDAERTQAGFTALLKTAGLIGAAALQPWALLIAEAACQSLLHPNTPASTCAYKVLAMLTSDATEQLRPRLEYILTSMTQAPLGAVLAQSLSEIACSLPNAQTRIQSAILDRVLAVKAGDMSDDQLIPMLELVAVFDWQNLELDAAEALTHGLMEVLEARAADRTEQAQLLAAKALSGVTQRAPGLLQPTLLKWLIRMAVSAARAAVRLEVFQLLAAPWCQLDLMVKDISTIRQLGFALYDESTAVQHAAVNVIGQNAALNPFHLHPLLLKKLLQVMNEVRHQPEGISKLRALSVLHAIVQSAHAVLKPHVKSILSALTPLLVLEPEKALEAENPGSQGNRGVDTSRRQCKVLAVTSALAAIDQQAIQSCLPKLFEVGTRLLEGYRRFSDDEVSLVLETLSALVLLVESTGVVMQPYSMQPNLMPLLLTIVTSSKSDQRVRLEAGRLLGAIGAICPFKLGRMLQGATWDSTRTKRFAAEVNPISTTWYGMERGQVKPTFATLDLNNDGFVDQDEFNSFALTMAISQSRGGPGVNAPLVAGTGMNAPIGFSLNASLEGDISEDLPEWSCASHEDHCTVTAISVVRDILGSDARDRLESKLLLPILLSPFEKHGPDSPRFLPIVMPLLQKMVRERSARLDREELFMCYANIVNSVSSHITGYVDNLMLLATMSWREDPALRAHVMLLLNALAAEIPNMLKQYYHQVLPLLLDSLKPSKHSDSISDSQSPRHSNTSTTSDILRFLELCGSTLDDHLDLLIPGFMSIFEPSDTSQLGIRIQALKSFKDLASTISLGDQASPVCVALLRVLSHESSPHTVRQDDPCLRLMGLQVKKLVLDIICEMIQQMGADFRLFLPGFQQEIAKQKLSHSLFETLICNLADSKRRAPRQYSRSSVELPMAEVDQLCYSIDEEALDRVLRDLPTQPEVDGWVIWKQLLVEEVLKQSPDHSLRCCNHLVKVHTPAAHRLLCPAILSCWKQLSSETRERMVQTFEVILDDPRGIPPQDIVRSVLELAEFMSRSEQPFPLDICVLCRAATRLSAHCTALFYSEARVIETGCWKCNSVPEGQRERVGKVYKELVGINRSLNLIDSSIGVHQYCTDYLGIALDRSELLQSNTGFHQMSPAEVEMHRKLLSQCAEHAAETDLVEAKLQQIQCLYALSRWEEVVEVAAGAWDRFSDAQRQAFAKHAALSALQLGDWDSMELYSQSIKATSHGDHFCKAAIALHHNELTRVTDVVHQARLSVDKALVALGPGSNEYNDPEAQYFRVYKIVVRLQRLTEIEEAVRGQQDANYRTLMMEAWNERLRGMTPSAEVWQRSRAVHCLILSPQEQLDMELMFVGLCRQTGRKQMSERTILRLCAKLPSCPTPSEHPDPRVQFQWAKTMWGLGHQTEALTVLSNLTSSPQVQRGDRDFFTRCLQKHGEYLTSGLHRTEYIDDSNITTALHMLQLATQQTPARYRAWHKLATLHYQIVAATGEIDIVRSVISPTSRDSILGEHDLRRSETGLRRTQSKRMLQDERREFVHAHVVPAVKGFIRAMHIDDDRALQDKLRLFRLWCSYGDEEAVRLELEQAANRVPAHCWLPIASQILACIDIKSKQIRAQIRELVIRMAQEHPQALALPLIVLAEQKNNEQSLQQKEAAVILQSLGENAALLVREARLLKAELERAAVLWEEQCKMALDRAATNWFAANDQNGALGVLDEMHRGFETGLGAFSEPHSTCAAALTPSQVAFVQQMGAALWHALKFQRNYQTNGVKLEMQRAWRHYRRIFNEMCAKLEKTKVLSLASVAPLLQRYGPMQLAIPGSYKPFQPVDTISGFEDKVVVLPSKQRPRKIKILSSKGFLRPFLLKGNEDLRQDERVMQLLRLVNSLLGRHRQQLQMTMHAGLMIPHYAIVPLSVTTGLAEWVPNTDTIQTLISGYRTQRGIPARVEMERLHEFCNGKQGYEQLPLVNKIEAFEEALCSTSGTDLYKIMWLKAPNAQEWVRRRTHYTKTLAANSMVGYILGLGDRHPQNIMIERTTGNVVHIDYGECFEVTMHRPHFPEKMPFRLTRQLVNALPACKVEGGFRNTCEHVMGVIRDHQHSVLAMLEAFVHDPLINWRLLYQEEHPEECLIALGEDALGETKADDAEWGTMKGNTLAPPSYQDYLDRSGSRKELNAVAERVLARIHAKINGGEDPRQIEAKSVPDQVSHLILEATSHENLCQSFAGWCPLW